VEQCKSAGSSSVESTTCDLSDPKAVQKLGEQLAGKGIDVAVMK
jgi:short-subunit dehydrogenase